MGRPFIEIVCKSPSGKELVVQIVFDLQDFQLVRTLGRFDLDHIADLLTDQLLGHRAVHRFHVIFKREIWPFVSVKNLSNDILINETMDDDEF